MYLIFKKDFRSLSIFDRTDSSSPPIVPRIKEFLAFEACVNSSEGTKMVERVSRGERENRIKEDKWAQHGCRDHSHECSCIRARFTFVAFSRPAPCFFRAPGKHFLRYVKKISFFLYYCSKIEPLVFTSLFRIFDCNCKTFESNINLPR